MNQLPSHTIIALAAVALPLWLSCAPTAPDTNPPPGSTTTHTENTTAQLNSITAILDKLAQQRQEGETFLKDGECLEQARKDDILKNFGIDGQNLWEAQEKCRDSKGGQELAKLLKDHIDSYCNNNVGYKQQKSIDLGTLGLTALAGALTSGNSSNFATDFNSAIKTSLDSENTAINNYNSQISSTSAHVLTCKSSTGKTAVDNMYRQHTDANAACATIIKEIIIPIVTKPTCPDKSANTTTDDKAAGSSNNRGSEGLE